MSAVAHLHGHVRWPGKPTSGRYVYKSRSEGEWYWQCDLHDDPVVLPEQYGEGWLTMQGAFRDAMAHARVCSARYPEEGADRTNRSRDA